MEYNVTAHYEFEKVKLQFSSQHILPFIILLKNLIHIRIIHGYDFFSPSSFLIHVRIIYITSLLPHSRVLTREAVFFVFMQNRSRYGISFLGFPETHSGGNVFQGFCHTSQIVIIAPWHVPGTATSVVSK